MLPPGLGHGKPIWHRPPRCRSSWRCRRANSPPPKSGLDRTLIGLAMRNDKFAGPFLVGRTARTRRGPRAPPAAGNAPQWCLATEAATARLTSGNRDQNRQLPPCAQSASSMKPSKKAERSWKASSGSTSATYWSGRTTTAQPRSRSMPRISKISTLPLWSEQNIFS
jgi:hypothetical protein